MRFRTFLGTPKHQLVLSLTPRSLHILHVRRSALGWQRVHQEQHPLPAGDAFLSEAQAQLEHRVRQWRLPPATQVHVVLAGDILGLIAASQPDVPAGALLPFATSDIRTQPDLFTRSEQPTLLWIHNDWLAEIERICEQCGLQLVELYARAQLLQHEASRAPGTLKVVLEQDEDQRPEMLHIYGPQGALLRSRVLDENERHVHLADALQAELAALAGSWSEDGTPASLLSASQPAGNWPGLRWQVLPALSEGERLWRLWRSGLEGIVVRTTHGDVSTKLKALSVAMGIIGTLALGTMIWHDGKLRQQIEEVSADVRRDAPRVAEAEALKRRSLHMADAVQAFEALQRGNSVLEGLALLTRQFPPPPAVLLYARFEPTTLAFIGNGDEASARALRERSLPGYGPMEDLAVPDFLAEMNPTIHLQAQRRSTQPLPTASQKPQPGEQPKP